MTGEAVVDDPAEPATPPAPASRRRRVGWRTARAPLCWTLVGGFALYTVGRAFGLEHTYPVDMLMAFTPYLALASLVPLGVAVALRNWWATGLAAVVCLALALLVVPRAFGGPDPGPGPRITVMSSNMKIGAADPATIVGLVRAHHVDVLAIEEYTPAAQDALLAAGLGTLLPYSVRDPVPDTARGSAVYSRYPFLSSGVQHLPAGFHQAHATIAVPGALPVEVYTVHAFAPVDPSRESPWWHSLAEEPKPAGTGPVRLLAGDFNATLDQVALRRLVGSGYRDIADVLGDGLVPTWPYDGRPVPPITLDHVLADPRIGAVSFSATTVPGTDHRAILATVTLPVPPG